MQDNYYKGKAALVDRFLHAVRGIYYAWEKESNFRIEVGIAIVMLGAMFVLPLTFVERAVLVLIIGLILSLEIINSVFERFLDLLRPEFSPEVKHIKDTLAGTVLLASFISVIIAGFILVPAFLEFDFTAYEWMASREMDTLENLAQPLTVLGSWQFILGLVIILTPWLVYKKRHDVLSLLLGSVIGGEIIAFVLKSVFERARPFLGDGFSIFAGSSFPSGHALVGAAFWLTAGYILTAYSTKRKFIWVAIGVIIALIALSRVVLSVHWFSDIVAGLLLGTTWFFLWFGINKHLFQKL